MKGNNASPPRGRPTPHNGARALPNGARALSSEPVLVAIGVGGRVELWEHEIRIVKGGLFGHLVELLRLGHSAQENTLFLDQIASVKILRHMILPDVISFSYPGSPDLADEYLHDGLAENALIMNLVDNRPFFAIKQAVEDAIISRRVHPALVVPADRRRWASPRDRTR